MTVLAALGVVVLSVLCVALVGGPVSRFARGYVYDLEEASAGGGGTAPVRVRWLVSPVSQVSVALVVCSLTGAWGVNRGAWTETLVALPVVAVLGSACTVDAVCHRLPNRMLALAAVWLAGAIVVVSVVDAVGGTPVGEALWPAARALLCLGAAGGGVLVLALLPSGLGMGDVKLCAVAGLWLGHLGAVFVLVGIVLGFFLAGSVAIVLMVARVVGRKQFMALGPYLAVGGWLAWFLAAA